ncbi:NACHT domain-containing protein [Pectobacterium carotovorum]|uniref:NACHT domain-containing protein n=1 Tax=Pectobacterium carotovorum TaxID=554 RepID=UPI003017D8BA
MEPSTLFTTAVAKVILTESSKKIYSALDFGNKARKIIAKFKVDAIAESYVDKTISRVLRFRTLTSKGATSYLDEVYYPLKIVSLIENTFDDNQYDILIKDGVRIIDNGCIVLSGRAGQGKTTIMRKLFIEELKAGERFPFFITLRDYSFDRGYNCSQLLKEHLSYHGVECSQIEVDALLKSGKVIIFFDGFDEIKKSDRNHALRLIDGLFLTYGCPSIVTTRPETEIEKNLSAQMYQVKNLNSEDVFGLIDKLVKEYDLKKTIFSILEKNSSLRETICTPILVNIFIITYPSLNNEPQSVADFYSMLFHALIYKHDASKSFIREKLSKIDNKRLEDCFSFFSLTTYLQSISTFSHKDMCEYFYAASEYMNLQDIHEQIMSDVVDGTNLITLEGHDRYVYIHRSIQEYFSAKCIASFDEENKKGIYTELSQGASYFNRNESVLKMLSLIDASNFCRFYLIPRIEKSYGSFDKLKPVSFDDFKTILFDFTIFYSYDPDESEYKIPHFSSNRKKDIIYETEIIAHFTAGAVIKSNSRSVIYGYLYSHSDEILRKISQKHPRIKGIQNYIKGLKEFKDNPTNLNAIDSKYWLCFLPENVAQLAFSSYVDDINKINKYVEINYYHKKASADSILKFVKKAI